MSQNVMIPLSLLDRMIELLNRLDIAEYGYPLRDELGSVLWALNIKKKKLELRDAYAKIIQAGCQDDRDEARILYLQQKMALNDAYDPPF